eukprot:1845062-Prymnesium_polylepis.1
MTENEQPVHFTLSFTPAGDRSGLRSVAELLPTELLSVPASKGADVAAPIACAGFATLRFDFISTAWLWDNDTEISFSGHFAQPLPVAAPASAPFKSSPLVPSRDTPGGGGDGDGGTGGTPMSYEEEMKRA